MTPREALLKDKMKLVLLSVFLTEVARNFSQVYKSLNYNTITIQIPKLPTSSTSKRDGPEAPAGRVQNTFSTYNHKNNLFSRIYMKTSKNKATCDKYAKEVLLFKEDASREITI